MTTGATETRTMTGTMTSSPALVFGGELRVTSVDGCDGSRCIEQIGMYVMKEGGVGITKDQLLQFYVDSESRHVRVIIEPLE